MGQTLHDADLVFVDRDNGWSRMGSATAPARLARASRWTSLRRCGDLGGAGLAVTSMVPTVLTFGCDVVRRTMAVRLGWQFDGLHRHPA